MTFKSPIGVDDFEDLIENGYTYVDKTLFIEDVLENPGKVQLLLRPRRFGKTLNMSTLAHFFDCRQESHHLFKGLHIEQRPCFEKCGSHPVIFLSFKDLAEPNFSDFVKSYRNMMMGLFANHEYLFESLSPLRQKMFMRYAEGTLEVPTLKEGLKWLSQQLKEYHEKSVVLLIDEYDAPILEGYRNDYYSEIINFMRGNLSAALKSNTALEKAVLTGILRVSKESIFSGLNNVEVYGVEKPAFADKFGFTESETMGLLELVGQKERSGDVQRWYNGYKIGETIIYNPWSLLKFLQVPHELNHYWLNTSSNHLIYELLLQADGETKEALFQLMKGKTIPTSLKPNTAFRDLDGRSLLTLFLYSGYLTIEKKVYENEAPVYHLRIPNREVRFLYKDTFIDWLSRGMGQKGMPDMLSALTEGNIEHFGMKLAALVGTVFSYYDTAGATPERVYHAFLLGLLSHVHQTYHVRSNPSGFGRYDVMMIPKDPSQAGFVFEFKAAARPEDLEGALQAGLDQIREQNYRAELEAQGLTTITEIAIAFCGKEVRVRTA